MRHPAAHALWAAALWCPAALGGDCPGDINASGDVTVQDLLILFEGWGSCPLGPCLADLNGDGVVDTLDAVVVLDCWGPCPCNTPGGAEVFDEVVTVDVTEPGAPARVTHVYATGDGVAVGDVLLAAGFADIEVIITSLYYQHDLGDDAPPLGLLCDLDPDVCDDTFFTMNLLTDDDQKLVLAPDATMSIESLTGSWFVLPIETEREAVDISGVTGNPGQAGVLIAQISWNPFIADACDYGYAGSVTLFTASEDGGTLQGTEALVQHVEEAIGYCPQDCVGRDGLIGIDEFLTVVGSWGQVGVACDFASPPGVGIDEFLAIIGLWGPCCP